MLLSRLIATFRLYLPSSFGRIHIYENIRKYHYLKSKLTGFHLCYRLSFTVVLKVEGRFYG